MPGTYSSLLLHIVCSTRQRQPWLAADLRPRLFRFMGGIIRAEGGVTLAINGVDDHFHTLVRWRTDGTIADLMRNLKARSSRWIHEQFPALRRFAWQEGYSVFTVSRSQKERVERYIAGQERRHGKESFKQELIALLDAHEAEYDPRYVFD